MKKREDRRARTHRHAERALRIIKTWNPSYAGALGRCAKSFGCRCERRRKGNPKVPGSLCHRQEDHYHPSVVERIRGARLARAWCGALREGRVPDDIEL